MRFGVLGTLTVVDDDGGRRRLSGPARRRLLGALVARCGRTVSIDTLVEDLWAGAPPATAERTLQSHVVRLRDDLGRDDNRSPIITEPTGYRLDVAASAVDAWCFERDLGAGRRALAEGDFPTAISVLDQALSWWRGDAYAEFPDAAFAVSERLRLHELRALAAEARTEAALGLGASAELVGELEQRVLEEPYRERSWEQLVLALYRAGRQGDALSAYRRARERLVDDLGLEPSAGLRALERRVLDQDPGLDVPLTERGVAAMTSGTSAATAVTHGSVALASPAHVDQDDDSSTAGLAPVAVRAPECPYRGLSPYAEEDGDVFVGRERLTAELAGRLVDNDLLVVVGPSGAGKSSLLRAGLVPALRSGAIPGSAAWRIRVVTPGHDPVLVLDETRCDLLVVDQAEELFTLAAEDDADVRRVGARLSALLAAGTRVVLAVRADFYGRLAELDLLTGRIGNATALVGPLSEEETRRVVVEPAHRRGISVSPAVVTEILGDVAGRPGSLPLLSAALEQAWTARTGDLLSVESYHRGGGVRGALETMAEATFAALDAAEQAAARRILLRLTTLSTGAWVRRPVPLDEIAPHGDDVGRRALEVLAAHRLVLVGTTTVELTHEALLTGWPRLRSWLDARSVMAEQLEHLERAASAWDRADRAPEDLIRGPRLQAALDWHDQHPDDLTSTELAYLDASRAAVDAELGAERARRRRLTAAVVAVTVVALMASLVGAVAATQKRKADAAALSADARRLAAESYQAPDSATSELLAAAAYRLEDSVDTKGALLSAVQDDGGALYRVPHDARIMWTGGTPDGTTVLAVDQQRVLYALSPTTRGLTRRGPIPGYWVADLSPDGAVVVTCGTSSPASDDQVGAGPVTVVRAADATVERVLPTASVDNYSSRCGRFTLDGRWFVVADTPHADASGAVDALAVYDAQDWSAAPRFVPEPSRIADLGSSQDRVAVRLEDGTLQVLRPDTLRTVTQVNRRDAVCNQHLQCFVAISPDNQHVAYSSSVAPQVPAQLAADELSAEPVRTEGLGAAISSMAYSPDSTRLATSGFDGSLLVQTVGGASPGTTIQRVAGGGPSISIAAFAGTGDATALYSAGSRELVSWSLSGIPRTVQLGDVAPSDEEPLVRVGNQLAGTRGSTVFVTDLARGRTELRALPADAGDLWRLSLSADGSRVALTFNHGSDPWRYVVLDMGTGVTLLDRSDVGPTGFQPPDDDRLYGAVLTADGTALIVSSRRDELTLLDVGTGATLRTLHIDLGAHAGTLMAVPWLAPDRGSLVVEATSTEPDLARSAQSLLLVDPATGRVEARGDVGTALVTHVEPSPDKATLAVTTQAGTLRTFDGSTLDALAEQSRIQVGRVRSVSWSPDGATLVTGATDGLVSLWDAPTLGQIGESARVGGFGYGGVVAWFQSSGAIGGITNGTIGQPGVHRMFTMLGTPDAWLTAACSVAGRELTPAEWQRYVGDREQIEVCPHR